MTLVKSFRISKTFLCGGIKQAPKTGNHSKFCTIINEKRKVFKVLKDLQKNMRKIKHKIPRISKNVLKNLVILKAIFRNHIQNSWEILKRYQESSGISEQDFFSFFSPVLNAAMKANKNPTDPCDVSPLDNSTDVILEPSSHQRLRSESTLFNHFLNRIPTGGGSSVDGSGNHSRVNHRINPWSEVSGEWFHQQSAPNPSEHFHYSENHWHDSDHMDVPLLISGTVSDFTELFFLFIVFQKWSFILTRFNLTTGWLNSFSVLY